MVSNPSDLSNELRETGKDQKDLKRRCLTATTYEALALGRDKASRSDGRNEEGFA